MRSKIYEIGMSILALVAFAFAILDISKGLTPTQTIIDYIIYVIFVLDYGIRLVTAKNKKDFIKHNILDLIAIIPFNSMFRIFRAFKLVRLLKILKLTKLVRVTAYFSRFYNRCSRFLNTNGFKYMLIICAIFILAGTVSISAFENMSLQDALWWSFVTTTTVGYGDLSPTTIQGRIVAVMLMLVGIGLISSLTSTITSFFMNTPHRQTAKEKLLHDLTEQINDVDNLSDDDIDTICDVLKTLNK